jgi:predicted TIM-barrel fold metal-dependent hydrolase
LFRVAVSSALSSSSLRAEDRVCVIAAGETPALPGEYGRLARNAERAPPAAAAEAATMIIDIHGHIGHLRERASSDQYLDRYLDECGILQILLANLDASRAATDTHEVDANVACLAACRRDPRRRPLYWVRPGRDDSHPTVMVGALTTEPFAGAFLAPALDGYGADAKLLDPYFTVLNRLSVPVLVLAGREPPFAPGNVYAVARRHPAVPVVLAGVSKTTTWHEAVAVVERSARQRDALLLLATGIAAAADVVAAVRALGGDRVLYGSDATVLGEQHARHCLATLDELRRALPPDTFARITQENARRVFRLHALAGAVAT